MVSLRNSRPISMWSWTQQVSRWDKILNAKKGSRNDHKQDMTGMKIRPSRVRLVSLLICVSPNNRTYLRCVSAESGVCSAWVCGCTVGLYGKWELVRSQERRGDLLPPKCLPSYLSWNMPAQQPQPAKDPGFSWHFIRPLCLWIIQRICIQDKIKCACCYRFTYS